MNVAQTIYQRSLQLPENAAQEALDFIDFLLQRYAASPAKALLQDPPQHNTAAFLRAVTGGWGNDIPDDIDEADLGIDTPWDML